MHLCSDVGSDQRLTIFCAENNVGNKMCEGSAHIYVARVRGLADILQTFTLRDQRWRECVHQDL